MDSAARPPGTERLDAELRSLLGRNREALLRRALVLAVQRSTLDQLAERSLGERLDELELLFEAAGGAAAAHAPGGAGAPAGHHDLQSELERQLDQHRRNARPCSVAVIAAGPARIGRLEGAGATAARSRPERVSWSSALREAAAPGDVVLEAGDGATAVILPDHGAREARMAAERLCRAAWRLLGEQGELAGAGIATYPDDGSSGYELLAAAYDALWRQAEFAPAEPPREPGGAPAGDGDERPPAPVHPLRPA